LNNDITWVTADEIIMLEVLCMDNTYRANSSDCPWVFSSSSVAQSFSSLLASRSFASFLKFTVLSRAADLLASLSQVAVSEVLAISSFWDNSSLDFLRACSLTSREALSSARGFSAADWEVFSLESAFWAIFSCTTSIV
jgi:hypothetical protein